MSSFLYCLPHMNKNTPVTDLKGIGPKTAELFYSRGIHTAGDLLTYYPVNYETFDPPVRPADALPGRTVTLALTISGRPVRAGSGARRIVHIKAAGEGTEVRLTWFNMPYIGNSLPVGSRHYFRGTLGRTGAGLLYMEQPGIYSPAAYAGIQGTMQPRYSLTRGLKNNQVKKAVGQVLEEYVFPEDYITEEDRALLDLTGLRQAYRQIHFPMNMEELSEARRRLIFDEFFEFILSVRRQKEAGQELVNTRPMADRPEVEAFAERLPFALTEGQKQAWSEIRRDLTGPRLMNRLLQGDVGSGKTILAFLALYLCAANGRQGALMAPTEVLAGQHMKSLTELIERYDLPLRPVLLTGSLTAARKRDIYERIRLGMADIIIGTHALIQDAVEYKDLGLVITDEQHRFGVRQRENLAGRGDSIGVLVMSATPIPRTLAIILYGDLQVSELRELPAGRLPIKNLAMPQAGRGKALRFILRQIAAGRQAYIICPAVEEGMMEELENVTDYTEKLRGALPAAIRIASLHGRMRPAEKDAVMEAFAAHETDILVSTTVVEVGINVPNATVMMVENAERFGLSQLHQLRGRVGRGKEQSYCIFLYAGEGEKPERLQVLEKNNDGFKIAEEDLKLRGPGDIFGTRQSGEMGFVMADIYHDANVMKEAAAYVDTVLARNPDFALTLTKSVDFRSI